MNLLRHVHGSTNMEKRSNKRNDELMANVTERQNSILRKSVFWLPR
jgi:hypothetical protein